MIKICKHCNEEFKTYNKNQKCCSRSCGQIGKIAWLKGLTCQDDSRIPSGVRHGGWKGGKIEIVCQICGDISYDYPSRNHKYCSNECYLKSIKQKIVELVCLECHNLFLRPIPRYRNQKFCSHECYYIWQSKNTKGEKSQRWQGGISKEPYAFEFTNELKALIRYRDGYKCQKCGCPEIENNQKLTSHHIDYNKQNSKPSNLTSLCKGCNSKVNSNRSYWTKYFTKKVKEIMKSPLQLHLNYEVNKKEVVQSL